MRAVDTNVLVRLLARDDAAQVARAERFVERGAWVSLLVLQEAMWVLESLYECPRRAVATLVDMLLEHDKLVLENPEVVRRALADFRSSSSVELADCLILNATRAAGHTPLGTFDRKLLRLEGTSAPD